MNVFKWEMVVRQIPLSLPDPRLYVCMPAKGQCSVRMRCPVVCFGRHADNVLSVGGMLWSLLLPLCVVFSQVLLWLSVCLSVTAKCRRQVKAVKPKKMIRLEGRVIVSSACNCGTSALVSREGEVYLYGKDTLHCDSATGMPCVCVCVYLCLKVCVMQLWLKMVKQGLYRPWKVLELKWWDFQAWKVLEKGIGPGKVLEF